MQCEWLGRIMSTIKEISLYTYFLLSESTTTSHARRIKIPIESSYRGLARGICLLNHGTIMCFALLATSDVPCKVSHPLLPATVQAVLAKRSVPLQFLQSQLVHDSVTSVAAD